MTQPKPPTFGEDAFADDAELQERIAATQREYGTYEAAGAIYAGNARAYNEGHPVPLSNVLRHGYWFNGQVRLQSGAEHPPEMLALIKQAETPDVGVLHVIEPATTTDEDGDK